MNVIDDDKFQAVLNEAVDRITAQLGELVGSLNGWELTITIPQIVLKLSKPSA